MADPQPTISTHVLDVAGGQPAAGISVALYAVEGEGERLVGGGTTDGDGRIRRLLDGPLATGDYRIEFSVDGDFFHQLAIRFHVADAERSYHLPLLLAPYSLATYRGS